MTLTDRTNVQPQEPATDAELRSSVQFERGEVPIRLSLRHSCALSTTLRYELIGNPNGPLLIIAGGISAGRHVLSSPECSEPGWWESQSGSLAPDRNRILAIDWIGADGTIDLPIDPADQADAIATLLDELGLSKATAFVGASYGGMVGMHFAARHPAKLGGLLAISAAAQPDPFASACRSLQRQALSLGEGAGLTDAGIALARAMAMLTYRTPQEFAEKFANEPAIEHGRVRVGADDYLAAHGARHCRRMTAVAYRRLSESIDLHRVDPADIRVPLTLAAVDRDSLIPAADVQALAEAAPTSRFHLVSSIYGHDAFLKEDGEIAAIITDFLSSLEHPR